MTTDFITPRSLRRDATIRQAFEMLAGTFGMVVTVTTESGQLEGVVTDGDLRKAILQGWSLDGPLEQVMNQQPLYIDIESTNQIDQISQLKDGFRKRGVDPAAPGNMFAIPVVDKRNVVIGLTSLQILEAQTGEIVQASKLDGHGHILVVGGAGYIGSVLVEKLLAKGWCVKVLDNLLYKQEVVRKFEIDEKFSFVQGDVCDLSVQVDAIDGVNCVVFLAEIVGDPSCEYLPETALKTNYLAVNSMAALCSHMQISRFIYTSSCSVYGASMEPDVILTEHSPVNPVSHYARMKIASENAVFNQGNELFSPTILRLATVFGLSHRPRMDLVLNTFAKHAFFRGYIRVFGGNQWRPNVHVDDVAESIISVINSPLEDVSHQIFNVGSNSLNYTIMELAKQVKSVFPDTQIDVDDTVTDSRNYRVDFAKLKSCLGFEPSTSVITGLKGLREAFETGVILDPDNQIYSNIESLREINRA